MGNQNCDTSFDEWDSSCGPIERSHVNFICFCFTEIRVNTFIHPHNGTMLPVDHTSQIYTITATLLICIATSNAQTNNVTSGSNVTSTHDLEDPVRMFNADVQVFYLIFPTSTAVLQCIDMELGMDCCRNECLCHLLVEAQVFRNFDFV